MTKRKRSAEERDDHAAQQELHEALERAGKLTLQELDYVEEYVAIRAEYDKLYNSNNEYAMRLASGEAIEGASVQIDPNKQNEHYFMKFIELFLPEDTIARMEFELDVERDRLAALNRAADLIRQKMREQGRSTTGLATPDGARTASGLVLPGAGLGQPGPGTPPRRPQGGKS